MSRPVAIPIGYRSVALIDKANLGVQNRNYRSIELTIIEASAFDEQGGYAPAESVAVRLHEADLFALSEALSAALHEMQQPEAK